MSNLQLFENNSNVSSRNQRTEQGLPSTIIYTKIFIVTKGTWNKNIQLFWQEKECTFHNLQKKFQSFKHPTPQEK